VVTPVEKRVVMLAAEAGPPWARTATAARAGRMVLRANFDPAIFNLLVMVTRVDTSSQQGVQQMEGQKLYRLLRILL
jgi:hypothetical protein